MTALVQDWRQHAHCRDTDPEAFYPETTDSATLDVVKRICASCPVRAECLNYADDNDIRHGVWGGLTPEQRGRPTKRPGVVVPARPCDGCQAPFHSSRKRQRFCRTCSRQRNPAPTSAPAPVVERGPEIAQWRRDGASDREIARVFGVAQSSITIARRQLGIGLDGTVAPRDLAGVA